MFKTASLLALLAMGVMVVGCSEGRRSMAVSGPYHDVELGYEIEEDAYGDTDINLVRDVEHHHHR